MPWIETIAYAESSGRLRQLYERIKGPSTTSPGPLMRS